MKAFTNTLRLTIIAMMIGISSLHAQWDTIKNYSSWNTGERINDIFFIGSTGYAVGHQYSSTSPFYQLCVISKTTNGGLNWNTTTLPQVVGSDTIFDLQSVYFTTPTTGYVCAVCVPYNDGNLLYGALLKTTDAGSTWSTILTTRNQVNFSNGTHVEFYDVQFTSLYAGYIAASLETSPGARQGVIYTTTNGGANWYNSTALTGVTGSALYFNNSSTGSFVGGVSKIYNNQFINGNNDHYELDYWYGGQISRTTDGGFTWAVTYTDPTYAFSGIYFPSSQIGYVTGMPGSGTQGEILKTTDGGQTWNVQHTFATLLPRCVYFINDTIGFIGGDALNTNTSGIYKTIDGGSTWTLQTEPNTNSQSGRIVSLSFATPVTGYALDDSANVAMDYSASIYSDFSASSCSVFLGPDTTFCQQQGQLFATPGTPGNNYVFSWSPSTGLSDSTAQNPFVNHVSNQQYIVTMTDTVTNCTATDTIIVSAYESVWGPQYICSTLGDSTLLDLGPGATNYQWQSFTDTANNNYFLGNLNQETFWATQQGHYLAIAFVPGCGALTSYIEVDDTCGTYAWVSNVWPGDCNYDLTANNADALQIGLSYNTTGPTRPGASNSWVAQPMSDWSQNFTVCNYKHADSNGDGLIDANDTLAINLNYNNTHPYRITPVIAPVTAPTLSLVANYDTCGLQTLVTVDIQLGTSAIPVDSLYGISFRVTSDANLIDTTMTFINLNNTWLGIMNNNMFGFRKDFRSYGQVDAAEVRENHTNRLGGFGTIGTFSIVTTDNLSGIAICHLKVTDVTAVTVGQNYLTFNIVNDSVVIDPAHPAGISEIKNQTTFAAYPNPANDEVTVQTNTLATQIEICDLQGRVVTTIIPTSTSTVINTAQFSEGIYLLRVRNGKSVTTEKFSVVH